MEVKDNIKEVFTWPELLEEVKKELPKMPEGEVIRWKWADEPLRYIFKRSETFPGEIEVKVYEEDDDKNDPRGWSGYYPTLKNFDDFCITDVVPEEKRMTLEGAMKTYHPYDPDEDARMMFILKNGRAVVLSEECAVKFRKYLDKLRKGKAPDLEAKLCATPTSPVKIIYELTGEAPLAIYKTLDDYFKLHDGPADEELFPVQGRLPRWMKREDFNAEIYGDDFNAELAWDFKKGSYGVD